MAGVNVQRGPRAEEGEVQTKAKEGREDLS